MSDEVDNLLRRAMAVLDHQIPERTFDTLVERTLLRLHDPTFGEPLGEGSESLRDELALARAMRESRAAYAARASDSGSIRPAVDPAASLPGGRARSNRRPIVTVVGIGLAAAAGAMIFVSVHNEAVVAPEVADRARERADAVARNASPAGTVAASSSPADSTIAKIAVDGQPRVAKVPTVQVEPQPPASKPKKSKGGSTPYEGKTLRDKPTGPDAGGSSQGRGKQAGVPPQKLDKAMLDKQSLSSDDIQRGMRAIAPRAQACFAGTRGLATVQLTVAPSGQVQKVTVSGPFAGTSVGSCVERAAAAATFPPWDGEPQRFGYDYSLSD